MLTLLKNHPAWTIVAVVGAFISMAGIVMDGLEIARAGIPVWGWTAVGAAMFFSSVLALVSKQHNQLEGIRRENITDVPNAPKTESATSQKVMVDFEGPTYSLYDGRKRFKLLDAAFLWADCTPNAEPSTISFFPEAYAAYQLLSEAINDGDLKCYTVDRSGKTDKETKDPQPSWVLMREDLIAYANSIDKTPRFLFPDARSWMS